MDIQKKCAPEVYECNPEVYEGFDAGFVGVSVQRAHYVITAKIYFVKRASTTAAS